MSRGVFSDKPCGKLVTELLVVQAVFEVCGIGFFSILSFSYEFLFLKLAGILPVWYPS